MCPPRGARPTCGCARLVTLTTSPSGSSTATRAEVSSMRRRWPGRVVSAFGGLRAAAAVLGTSGLILACAGAAPVPSPPTPAALAVLPALPGEAPQPCAASSDKQREPPAEL